MHPRKTKKALTSTISTVILICIAIAVSFATLAWMNGLPTPDMQIEDVQVTSYQVEQNLAYVDVTLYNNGTQTVKIISVTVNSQPTRIAYIVGSPQINTRESILLRVANAFIPEETYQLTLQTAKGSKFVYQVTI
jgi:archaellum component FlaF (FlaF/FlaG flagellin family)